jgi:hypothetical protein
VGGDCYLAGAAAALHCSRSGRLFIECIRGERTAIRQAETRRDHTGSTKVNRYGSEQVAESSRFSTV